MSTLLTNLASSRNSFGGRSDDVTGALETRGGGSYSRTFALAVDLPHTYSTRHLCQSNSVNIGTLRLCQRRQRSHDHLGYLYNGGNVSRGISCRKDED